MADVYLFRVVIKYRDTGKLWPNTERLLKKLSAASVRSFFEFVGERNLLYGRGAGEYGNVCEESRKQNVSSDSYKT